MSDNLELAQLDEVEMYLQLLKADTDLSQCTCKDISIILSERFQINCSEEQVFLLHEPEVYDVWYEDAYYYKNILGL